MNQELATHLQSLITAMEDIVFEIDGNQIFKNVWVHDESMLFMPREAFLGKKIADVLGPQASLFIGPVDKVIQTGEAQEVVYKHLDPSIDQWFKVKIRPVRKSPDPNESILVLSIQDITRQKQAELILQETKERLELSKQLLDVSQELSQTAGWELNIHTGEVFWTRQAYVLFNQPDDFRPSLNNTRHFFEEIDRNNIDNSIEQAIYHNRSFDIETRIFITNSTRKWVRTIGSPVLINGQVGMLRGALMDITMKKEGELELIKARNEAEKASRSKSDFLSVMSHEIRTPLNGIIGIANLLKLNHTIDQREYVKNLIFSADHLMRLINDILDLTKIDNDKLELLFANINLVELIINIKNQFKSLAEAKGIRLKTSIDDEMPKMLIADPIRLGQMLNNLISNAIKFTEKGEITLMIKLLSMENNHARVHFSVKDSGMGIPEELQDTVFESFKQLQQSAYRKHSGTGLGLAIAQRLAKLHNSTILLKSGPGVGSEFYFDIDFELASDQNTPERLETSHSLADYKDKLTGFHALLVEDNPINTMVAQKQLEYFGVVSDCAANGDEALELLKNDRYDVALLDLHMPGIDGYGLAEIVRKTYPDMHLIIFTADIMMDVKVKFARLNIYDILNKPFLPEEMFDVLFKVAQARGILNVGP